MEERTLEEILAGIKPVKVKGLVAFLESAGPLLTAVSTGDVVEAIATHPREVLSAVAIGADVEVGWLEDQELDVLIELGLKVVEVNADFFARALVPKLESATERINKMAIKAPGGTSL